jgi:hypothetical protein
MHLLLRRLLRRLRASRLRRSPMSEQVCTECGYPLIYDPDVVIEYGPECGDCGGPAKTIM